MALNYGIATAGIYPTRNRRLTTADLLGTVVIFATPSFPPSSSPNYLPSDGRLLAINQNQVLYSLLGTIYGGNGTWGIH
jgi:microcystin-dependent protein